jgi:LAO/AO transport system kinase
MGFDPVLIETVGVGQDEVEIAGAADTTVVVVAPGMGDEVQVIKAGVIEIADVFVVNKADRDGADRAVADLEALQSFQPDRQMTSGHHGPALSAADTVESPAHGAWTPPIVRTVATAGKGVDDLVAVIGGHAAHLRATGRMDERRRSRDRDLLLSIVRDRAFSVALSRLGPPEALDGILDAIEQRQADPYGAAEEILVAAGLGPLK